MNEHSFVKSLHKYLKQYDDLHIWKINDNYAGGVPDAFIEGPVNDLWVEYKYIKPFPKRPTTPIDLSKMLSRNQQEWLRRRESRRGDTMVVVGSEHGAVMFERLSWEKPLPASAFIECAFPNKLIAEFMYNILCGQQVGRIFMR